MRRRLRPLTGSDREPFLAATRRSRDLHRPWVAPPTTPAAFRTFVADTRGRERLLLWGDEGGEDHLLGYFALNEIVMGSFRSAYLGYWAAAPHAGRGHMSAGMALLLRHAFRRARLHRVEANIQPGNRASLSLARRAGFRKEGFSPRYLKVGGRWRDHERWALTLEDWRAGSGPA